jgi:two-component system, NtrC family, nitrogen regulation sensor histidine kinase NtrY
MKSTSRKFIFLISAAPILLILALLAESLYFSDFEYHFRTARFNRVLHEKEKAMEQYLEGLKIVLAKGEPHGSASENMVFMAAEEEDITILEYMDKKLTYWSDNGFDVPKQLDDSLFARPIVFMMNGWFLPRTIMAGNETVVGLLRVRTEYGFENDIVKNGFGRDFRMPASAGININEGNSDFTVRDGRGQFLFSLVFPGEKADTPLILLPLTLWILLLAVIIFIALELTSIMARRSRPFVSVIPCVLIFTTTYLGVLFLHKPASVFRSGLFSPYILSLNSAIPSLGHLLILSILLFILAYVLFKYLSKDLFADPGSKKGSFWLIILLATGALLMVAFHYIFSQLVAASNINFETYKVLKLSFYSIAAFVCVILLSLVPFLYILKIFSIFKKPQMIAIAASVVVSLAIISILISSDKWSAITLAAYFIGIVFIVWFENGKLVSTFRMSVVFSVLLGLYSLYVIISFTDVKTTENLKIQALEFSTENDPEAEHMLLDIWPLMRSDTTLARMMNAPVFAQEDFNKISAYIHDFYFTGYWRNFNINIYLCPQGSSVEVGQNTGKMVDCYGFFAERVRKYGHLLTGTEFYFIDDQAGRPYYLGMLIFDQGKNTSNGLFIELYSDVNVFQPGYSELLLDKKFKGYYEMRDYSFAKYINGEIVLNSGDFPYDKNDDDYFDRSSDYKVFNGGGFKHVLFRNGNATVIISHPRMTTGNVIISFAYLFAFIFIFTNLVLLFAGRFNLRNLVNLNFRQKLQLSFIGVLLVSFILVGTVVAFLTINEFRSKHYDNVKEKLNSLYLALDERLAPEKRLSADWKNNSNASLNELLINLSNIFNTDINLYDLRGFLIATSRPEIYNKNLSGRRMNNKAFVSLDYLKKSEYLQTEQTGTLKYISEYVPFYNSENNVIAYLNIPYFRMQSLLAREISNLVVAVINFTLLLILITMSLAVFISGRLTSPLSMLSSGLASVSLGRKIEHLTYSGNDEIGELVREYNRMVDELDESARKLADSEREYAWREMAKQVAHEIKNPLTPMKLNVQQLLKSWRDKAPGFEDKIEAFSKSQVEYIDDLSSIASAFSSFAKLPGTTFGEVDLPGQVKTTLELFRDASNIEFEVKWPGETKVMIYADKEHINGIFSNLFKNSIQAIPDERRGIIKVALWVEKDKIFVTVSDNGNGIPESLRSRIFSPNFTTKSSGTGLGLSIVKKYVEEANGTIRFESEPENGTTFFMEFPLMYTVEKLR